MSRPKYDFLIPMHSSYTNQEYNTLLFVNDGSYLLERLDSIILNDYYYKDPSDAIKSLYIYKNRFAVSDTELCITSLFCPKNNWQTFDYADPGVDICKSKFNDLFIAYNDANLKLIDQIINFFIEVRDNTDLYLTKYYYDKIEKFRFEITQVQSQYIDDFWSINTEKDKFLISQEYNGIVLNQQGIFEKVKPRLSSAAKNQNTFSVWLIILFILFVCSLPLIVIYLLGYTN